MGLRRSKTYYRYKKKTVALRTLWCICTVYTIYLLVFFLPPFSFIRTHHATTTHPLFISFSAHSSFSLSHSLTSAVGLSLINLLTGQLAGQKEGDPSEIRSLDIQSFRVQLKNATQHVSKINPLRSLKGNAAEVRERGEEREEERGQKRENMGAK